MRTLSRQRPTMHETGEAGPPRWPLAVGVGVSVIVVLLLLVTAVGAVTGGKKKQSALPIPTRTPAVGTLTPTGDAPSTADTEVSTPTSSALPTALQLPMPTSQVQGVPTGYPHTSDGAVSAAYYFSSALGSTLNPDRGAVIARIVADANWTTAPDDIAAIVQNSRKALGLPPTVQASDGGAAAVSTPADFMLTRDDPDAVDVELLARVDGYNPADPSLNENGLEVVIFPMRWTDGDWRTDPLPGIDQADRTRLAVDPSSPTAAQLGWRPLHV